MKIISQILLPLLLLLSGLSSFGQKTPFNLSLVKKLDSADLASKDPGFHWEPLPQIGYDNLTGLSFGIIGSIFNNGKRTDSLYEFANYKFRLDFAVGGSYRGGQGSILNGDNQIYLKADAPFVGGSRFRLSGSLNIEHSPYNLYYGVNSASLRPIGDLSQDGNNNYNYFEQTEKLANVKAEYMLFHGFIWPFIGLQWMDEQMTAPVNSLLMHDFNNHQINGVGHTQIGYLRGGIKYDSRNNPDNTTSGVFAEITDEYSPKINAAGTNFNKIFFHVNYYKQLSQSGSKRFFHWNTPRLFGPRDSVMLKINNLHVDWFNQNILAVRYAFGVVNGSAPFYAYQDVWSSEDNISILGGNYDLRGFAENRFTSSTVSFINVELRSNIFKIRDYTVTAPDAPRTKPVKEIDYYDVALVPFFDMGGVWDKTADYWQRLNQYKISYGMGTRVVLNSDFVVRFDWGFSAEGSKQTFIMSHTF